MTTERLPSTTPLAGSLLAAFALPFALLACDAEGSAPPPPPTSRNNAVLAASGKPSAPATTNAASATPQKAAPRDPCAGQKERPGPTKGAMKTKAASGAGELPAAVAFGAGKWVWLNFWAAWCGPCKEEMPRLIAWQEKLRKAGVLIDLAFVSLDDDERQLERFLDAQPPAGVRASYWLPEGAPRSTFLASLHFKETPELPLQALVSPSGQLACAIQGAVEDRDYDALASFVGAKK